MSVVFNFGMNYVKTTLQLGNSPFRLEPASESATVAPSTNIKFVGSSAEVVPVFHSPAAFTSIACPLMPAEPHSLQSEFNIRVQTGSTGDMCSDCLRLMSSFQK